MVGGEHNADILILSSAIGSGHMRASAAVVRGTVRHNSVERLSWGTLAEQLVTIAGKSG